MTANLNVRYDYEPFLDYYNVTIDYPKQFLNYNEALDYYSVHFEYNRPIEGLDCDEWVEKREDALSFDFELDSIELSSQGQYFFGCSFDVYRNTYSERYISYLSDFPDANEIDFCNYELKKKLEYICSDKVKEKMSFSIKKRISFLENRITELSTHQQSQQIMNLGNSNATIINNSINNNYKETIWFKTGILLATGEAFDLYSKYKFDKGHFMKICKELGFKDSDRPYFSETINDNLNSNSDKNTFANKDKLQKLHKHITENKLNFGVEFLKKFNKIELE